MNFSVSFSDVVSLLALCLSLIVAFYSIWEAKPSLKVVQDHGTLRSGIFSFDGWDTSLESSKYPDGYYGNQYRVLVELILTNNSSKPLSIINFNLDGIYDYDSYTKTGEYYKITTAIGSSTHFGSPTNPINYLKPTFTIDSYTSVRGYIFFNISSDDEIFNLDKHRLEITSSRKVFVENIGISSKYKTIYPHKLFTPDQFKTIN